MVRVGSGGGGRGRRDAGGGGEILGGGGDAERIGAARTEVIGCWMRKGGDVIAVTAGAVQSEAVISETALNSFGKGKEDEA